MQHRSITDSETRRNVWRVQDRTDLLLVQVLNELVLVALGGDGTDLANLLQERGNAVFHITHEGLDGSQSHVTRHRTIAALALDVDQEVFDQRCTELLDMKL